MTCTTLQCVWKTCRLKAHRRGTSNLYSQLVVLFFLTLQLSRSLLFTPLQLAPMCFFFHVDHIETHFEYQRIEPDQTDCIKLGKGNHQNIFAGIHRVTKLLTFSVKQDTPRNFHWVKKLVRGLKWIIVQRTMPVDQERNVKRKNDGIKHLRHAMLRTKEFPNL